MRQIGAYVRNIFKVTNRRSEADPALNAMAAPPKQSAKRPRGG